MSATAGIMDGIVYTDPDGVVKLMNSVAEEILGARSLLAVGKPLRQVAGLPELVCAIDADLSLLASELEAVRTVEVHHQLQDLIYVKCTTSRVHDHRGRAAGALTVLRDITDEFKVDQLRNQYLSIVAHELRTPLTGIKAFATMMAKGALGTLGDRQQRACDAIREQSLRLEQQIDKLINLGTLDVAAYGQQKEDFPAAMLANGLLAPFEQLARDRNITLKLAVEDGSRMLHADREDLRRACQALVENAIKFGRDGGAVTVRIEADGDGVRFRVDDDGIGIDPRYHRRIFEKFFQVEDPLTRRHGGAGLGLFVAQGIVEAHGSRIEVTSSLGAGASFAFRLPMQVDKPPESHDLAVLPNGDKP